MIIPAVQTVSSPSLPLKIPHSGPWFLACLGLAVFTALVMKRQGEAFFTWRLVRQSFGIIDLELPGTPSELQALLLGIDALPNGEGAAVKRAVRGQLWVDFLFMAGIYPGTFLLCMKAAGLLAAPWAQGLFGLLAWAQAAAWSFDVIENVTLLRLLGRPRELWPTGFRIYLGVVVAKWVLALTGAICAVSALGYFWLARGV